MAAGVAMGRKFDLPMGFWVLLGAAGLVVAAATFRRKHLHLVTSLAIVCAIVAVGAIHVHQAFFRVAEDHIVTYTDTTPILATLRGRIVTAPMRLADTAELGYRRPDRTAFVLQATHVRTADGWQAVTGLARVSVQEPADNLAAGQEVELVGRIGRYGRPANPGQFDRAAAARKKQTLIWMTVPAADGATVLAGEKMPWYTRAHWNLRAASRQHLAGVGEVEEGRLLNALILGERHPAMDRLNRAMVRAGAAHFLSISGLHLGVFLFFIFWICRVCLLTPRRAAVVVLAVLGCYVLLAEPRAPLLRSAAMATALCLAAISRRRYGALNALSASAIVLLAIDPLQLFSPGFQLSFTIAAGLVVGYQQVRSMLFGRWLRRRGLMVFRSDQTMRRWLHFAVINRVMDFATIILLAYALAAPLAAYHFGMFSPYAIVLNVLLFPLVLMVLVPGYLAMALQWPLPGLAYSVGRVAAWSADVLAGAVEQLERLPSLSVELFPLPVGWLVLCYATGVLIVLRRRLPLGRPAAGLAVAALCAWTAISQMPAPRPAAAELNMLAVGNGQCAVLRTPSGRTYIIDAGSTGGGDVYRRILTPFLRNRRLPKPDWAFVSHANTDHFNALSIPAVEGRIGRVYFNDYFALEAPSPSLEESAPARFVERLMVGDAEIFRLRAGKTISLDERTTVEVLWPPARQRDDLSVNDTSLVLRIICDGRRILLPGDLDEVGQRALTATPQAIAADVLVLPHHGGWDRTLPEFVRAVDPQVVIASCRRDPTASPGDDRRGEFFKNLRRNTRYYSTARNGWIRVDLSRAKIDVETMR